MTRLCELAGRKSFPFRSVAVIILIILTNSAALPQEARAKWPTRQELLDNGKSAKPLEQSGLSASELKVVQAALTAIVNSKSCRGNNIQGCGALHSEVVGKVQITTDGGQAVVVRSKSDCGSAGCPMWIVQIAPRSRTLLEDFGWGYAILPSHENSYFDVVTAEGSRDSDLTLFRMKGEYKAFRCAILKASETDEKIEEQISEHPCPSRSSK